MQWIQLNLAEMSWRCMPPKHSCPQFAPALIPATSAPSCQATHGAAAAAAVLAVFHHFAACVRYA